MEGEEGCQVPQHFEVVKRRKNMEVEENEVVKRMKFMEGEEGSQQPQLVLTEEQEDLIRLGKTLIADSVLHTARFKAWRIKHREEVQKKDDEALLKAGLKLGKFYFGDNL